MINEMFYKETKLPCILFKCLIKLSCFSDDTRLPISTIHGKMLVNTQLKSSETKRLRGQSS